MSKKMNVILAILLLSAIMLPLCSFSIADENNPEVVGEEGTSKDGVPFRDIVAGWIEGETATEFTMTIQVAGPPARWIPDNAGDYVTNSTTYDYEFYFSFRGEHYSATGIISMAFKTPLSGLDVVQADGELRRVKYTPTFNAIENETGNTTLSVGWSSQRNAIELTIPKNTIGNPQVGEELTNLWVAIWNTDENPAGTLRTNNDAVDTAMEHITPGRNFEFTGGLEHDYELRIGASELQFDVNPGETASMNITVTYDTSNQEDANATATLQSTGGGGRGSLGQSIFEFNGSGSDTTIFTFTAPNNVSEDAYFNITIHGALTVNEGGVETSFNSNQLNITIRVNAHEDGDEETEQNFVGWLFDFMTTRQGMALLAGLVVVVVLVAVMLGRRKKNKR